MTKSNIKLTRPGVILLGFVALVTQVILLRELLTFFNGNAAVVMRLLPVFGIRLSYLNINFGTITPKTIPDIFE